jgi:hypothetical protein
MSAETKSSGTRTAIVAGTLLLAVSGFVWSNSSSEVPDVLTEARAATASAISPMEMMLQHRGTLPTERWDSF